MMIQLPQNRLGRRMAYAVIEGRKKIQQKQRRPVNTEADDLVRIALQRRQDHQQGKACKRRNGARHMTDAVESFSVIHRGANLRPPPRHGNDIRGFFQSLEVSAKKVPTIGSF